MKKRFQPAVLIFAVSVMWLNSGCASTSTPEILGTSESSAPMVAEVEELAGFDVKEPAYLPTGVSLDSARYDTTPSPYTTLQFKIIHAEYGDMGPFFMITQERQTEGTPGTVSCGQSNDGCEVLQIDDVPVVYHLYKTEDGPATESFEWITGGFFFRLHRMAGEPGKIYKDELLKVVESMK